MKKTWLRNQQFALEVFDEKGAEVCIELFQPDGDITVPVHLVTLTRNCHKIFRGYKYI